VELEEGYICNEVLAAVHKRLEEEKNTLKAMVE
jgi:hypothetical protein